MLSLLLASLKASPNGWRIPRKETLLGPTRKPNRLSNFRSKRVKKATEIREGRQTKTNFKDKERILRIYNKILNFTHIFCQSECGERKL